MGGGEEKLREKKHLSYNPNTQMVGVYNDS